MATVEKYYLKNGDPRWRVRFDNKKGSNRGQSSKSGFKKEGDANRYAKRLEASILDDTFVVKNKMLLSAAMDKYIEVYCSDLAPKTVEGYKSLTATIKKSFLADKPLQDITPEDIKIFANDFISPKEKGEKPRTANTANHYLRFLNSVFEVEVKNRRLNYNPCKLAGMLKTIKFQHHILTVSEYKSLLFTNYKYALYTPILLGGYMGLRKGEALGLTWDDIDFKANTIKVRQTRQIVEREEMIRPPKSDKSLRTLVMPSFVAIELKRIKEESIINIKHKLVCCESTGEPISINTFTARFKRALKKAGLPESVRYHDLRHTCAALMTLAGATPKEVSEYLGHSSIAITMDLYADVFDTSKAATAQKLDALMAD